MHFFAADQKMSDPLCLLLKLTRGNMYGQQQWGTMQEIYLGKGKSGKRRRLRRGRDKPREEEEQVGGWSRGGDSSGCCFFFLCRRVCGEAPSSSSPPCGVYLVCVAPPPPPPLPPTPPRSVGLSHAREEREREPFFVSLLLLPAF